MIIITMAGLSSRFYKAGYTLPKYALCIDGVSVFERAVRSFERYFKDEHFLFILRPDAFALDFVRDSLSKIGIAHYAIVQLDHDTRGQAETAYLGLKGYEDDFPLIIFNIDTIRHDYKKPTFINECDGYLEVFHGEGEHWSFVEPGSDGNVLRTTEKDRVSDLCSDGLYFFKSQKKFCHLFEMALANNLKTRGEFYVAPLYNQLIFEGARVKYDVIELTCIDFCGTPEEYQALINKE